MSRTHTSDGKRRSSQTHARRGHPCQFCDYIAYGNGGKVSHARAHVRRGEAVELVKEYVTWPPMTSRSFLPATDFDLIAEFESRGYVRNPAKGPA